MPLIEICRLDSNGKGGYEGFVRNSGRGYTGYCGPGKARFFVPDGSKFTIWQLGNKELDAYLQVALQPRDVATSPQGRSREQLLCRMWRMKRGKGHVGSMSSAMLPANNWEWELPGELSFQLYEDYRAGKRNFGLKIVSE